MTCTMLPTQVSFVCGELVEGNVALTLSSLESCLRSSSVIFAQLSFLSLLLLAGASPWSPLVLARPPEQNVSQALTKGTSS